MIKKLSHLIAVAALGSSAVLTLPASSSAAVSAASAPDCSAGYYCFYSEAEYEGKKKEVRPVPGTCYQASVSWPEGGVSRPASIYNNRSEVSQLEAFDNDTCNGSPYALLAYQQGASTVSDRAKSFRVAPRCDIGTVCIYENKDFTGKRWQISLPWTNRCYYNGEDSWGYGFYNNTNYTATFYRSSLCTIFPMSGVAPHQYGSFGEKVHLVKID
ncbi:peptidase inhibitor family I36 protein [Streptomyces sp. NPDC003943]